MATGESAAAQLPHLARLDPAHAWLRVSVQGLHRFYTRANQVVASWMTREDRLEAIADNAAYAEAVRQAVARDYPVGPDHVVVGFSQGAAQAYRAAARSAGACRGVIALGGDVPPDVLTGTERLPPVLIGRGRSDEWYTADKLQADREALRAAGVEVTVCEFDGGHEWARRVRRRRPRRAGSRRLERSSGARELQLRLSARAAEPPTTPPRAEQRSANASTVSGDEPSALLLTST